MGKGELYESCGSRTYRRRVEKEVICIWFPKDLQHFVIHCSTNSGKRKGSERSGKCRIVGGLRNEGGKEREEENVKGSKNNSRAWKKGNKVLNNTNYTNLYSNSRMPFLL